MRRILQVFLLSAALLPGQTTLGPSGSYPPGPPEETLGARSIDAPAALRASEAVRSAARLPDASHEGGDVSGGASPVGSWFPARLGPEVVATQLRRQLGFRGVLAWAHMGLACWPSTAPPPFHSA